MIAIWHPLLDSIRTHRSKDARFFKPVCLIAVIDGVLDGTLKPGDIRISAAIERFEEYVSPLFPKRSRLGWRPLWHLSNDEAWVFTRKGQKVKPDQFGSARKPDSLGQLLAKVDHLTVPRNMLRPWKTERDLLALREQLLAMLEQDDLASRLIAGQLRSAYTSHSGLAKSKKTDLDRSAVAVRGQGFQVNPKTRLAIELYATRLTTELFTAKGWVVEDVSEGECFDLRCTRNNRLLFVEVKGTTGDGMQIILTRAEVDFAKINYRSMVLVVVSGIEICSGDGDEILVSGGETNIFHPWRPSVRNLKPISFVYGLNDAESGGIPLPHM